ncbi:transcriptional regulator [Candidatus Kaiserbacteria bacterium RIFCSPHIGHO2_02_FULL_50_50]|uniref:Transcriptional regulator n=1 Tax=Candidatus Kaiserbacteria bacterium RIFCSPHIGHO2_02_FULL_50_50 TaxID=1798492 RepID=A0A1F6DD23_9BACT|nr:MAG: transcriptional regulator [Candidatus Kaiserbacteria bacterium RIFCSPHIGHO2_02_FULL_50_50]
MSTPTLKKLAVKIQDERKKRGFSQESFAHKIGVHRTYIGMIERAEKNITIGNLEKIAKGLDISLSKLLDF